MSQTRHCQRCGRKITRDSFGWVDAELTYDCVEGFHVPILFAGPRRELPVSADDPTVDLSATPRRAWTEAS